MPNNNAQNNFEKQEAQMYGMLPKIIVVGIGGGGIQAVNQMITCEMQGVEFIVVDYDEQALILSKAQNRIHLRDNVPKGAGIINTEDVQRAAAASKDILTEHLKGADLVFITACMGGDTGTGAAPIVAKCAREVGALTIGVVTKPFSFEGKRRMNQAEAGIANLIDLVDTLITISNDRLVQIIDRRCTIQDAFSIADGVLRKGVKAISDVLVAPGLINADITEVQAIMSHAGTARMGIGSAKSKNGAAAAADAAMKSPLLENTLKDAQSLLFNITGGENMTLKDVEEVVRIMPVVEEPEFHIIFGATIDKKLAKNEFQVSVIATNCSNLRENDKPPVLEKKDKPWKLNDAVKPENCTAGWIPRGLLAKERKTAEVLVPRSDGKKICNYLKYLRAELARANNIPFKSEKCTSVGMCAGTCAKCDQEASYLREKMNSIPEQKRKYPQHILENWEKVI